MGDYAYPHLPKELKAGLDRYAAEHIRPGDFLQSVLADELYLGFMRADPQNRQPEVMQDLLWYVHQELPERSHGTRLALDYWAPMLS